jgi:hypothetical protein
MSCISQPSFPSHSENKSPTRIHGILSKLRKLFLVTFSCLPSPPLSLLHTWSGFAFVAVDGMHHDFVGVLRCVARVSFAPIIADCVCEDIAV